MNRPHEKTQNHNQPGDEHDDDTVDMDEDFGKSRHVANLFQNRRACVDAGFCQLARLQER